MRRAFLLICALLILAGCVSNPTPEEVSAGLVGIEPPTMEKVRADIDDLLRGYLRDPGSAQVDLVETQPIPGWYRRWGFGKNEFGWLVHANVNAKNGYGGYTGFERWSFFWRNQTPVFYLAPRN